MALRTIETPHGTYFCCCCSLFHGQVCPDCKTFYENPYETLRLQSEEAAQTPTEPAKLPEGKQDEPDQEGDTTQTDAPDATSETTTPSAETTVLTTPEEAPAAPVAKQPRKVKQS